jgi:hypothetical protein
MQIKDKGDEDELVLDIGVLRTSASPLLEGGKVDRSVFARVTTQYSGRSKRIRDEQTVRRVTDAGGWEVRDAGKRHISLEKALGQPVENYRIKVVLGDSGTLARSGIGAAEREALEGHSTFEAVEREGAPPIAPLEIREVRRRWMEDDFENPPFTFDSRRRNPITGYTEAGMRCRFYPRDADGLYKVKCKAKGGGKIGEYGGD